MLAPFADPQDLAGFSDPEARLSAASALIRAYCGWHVAPMIKETFTLDGSGSDTLMLRSLQLTDVESVVENGAAVDGFEWSQAGFLRRSGRWTNRLRGITVTVTHGYEDVPAEITQVCCQVAARAIASPTGARTESAGGLSVTYAVPGGLLELERVVLGRYRLPAGA